MKSDKIKILIDRAEQLAKARSFFMERGVKEVDTPILSASASIDAHIDLIAASPHGGRRHLHSSPEYCMKRLLADGMGDIYQLSHVFRDGECGPKHNPEFMMAEWYRVGMSFEGLMQETVDFIRIFLGDLPHTIITYREAFLRYGDFDYLTISDEDLLKELKRHGIPFYPGIENEGKDALLNMVLATVIEPNLGRDELCVLAYYPSSQAALAQKCWREDEEVCERFEVYFRGVELANGYHELADPVEQRERLIEANEQRLEMGKELLSIDENFLRALQKGLPDCCGVAVGFDRLMMLRHHATNIGEVIPFDWEKA